MKNILVVVVVGLAVAYLADQHWYYGKYSNAFRDIVAGIIHHSR